MMDHATKLNVKQKEKMDNVLDQTKYHCQNLILNELTSNVIQQQTVFVGFLKMYQWIVRTIGKLQDVRKKRKKENVRRTNKYERNVKRLVTSAL